MSDSENPYHRELRPLGVERGKRAFELFLDDILGRDVLASVSSFHSMPNSAAFRADVIFGDPSEGCGVVMLFSYQMAQKYGALDD